MGHENQSAFGPPSVGPPTVTGPYEEYNLQALEAVGSQNAPSSPSGGAASQGALGNPPAGGGTPAFSDEKGEGEAQQPASDYHRMFLEANDEDKSAVADNIEKGGGDLSLNGMMVSVFEKGGVPAMELAKSYGYVPPEEKDKKTAEARETALSDYGITVDKQKEADAAEKARLEQRYAMGGFLMDVGLRILASNRDDAAGAIGEGILGAQEARTAKKDKAEDKKTAAEDRERKQRREDESDERSEAEEVRKANKFAYDESQREEKEKRAAQAQLEKIVQSDGTILYANPKEGILVDENGEKVRTMTDEEARKYSRQGIDKSASDTAIRRNMNSIQKLLDDGYYGEDEDMIAIVDETDSKKRQKLIRALAKTRASLEEDTVNYEDY